MSEFDRRIKHKVQNYLNQHISMTEEEVTNIQLRILKRRNPGKIIYVSAFSLLAIVIFISILPFIGSNKSVEFSPVPGSPKVGNEKELPIISQEDDPEIQEPTKKVDKNEQEEIVEQTEAELESFFLGLMERYNELVNYPFNTSWDDILEIPSYEGDPHPLVVFRVKEFDTKEEFYELFSDSIGLMATEKIIGNELLEIEGKLYTYNARHTPHYFEPDKEYEMTKVDTKTYQFTQIKEDASWDPPYDYLLRVELTNTNDTWLITDWEFNPNN